MKTRRRYFRNSEAAQNFWPSFTDVMSTVTIVLFFLMLLAYIQNIITGKNFALSRKELEQTELKLEDLHIQLGEAERELSLKKEELEKTKAEVEKGQKELALSKKEIEDQKNIIAMSNQELAELREKLEQIAVLRVDTLEKVKNSIEKEIGKTNDKGQPLVTIGDNANIVINESLVFDYDSSEIKEEGKKLLSQFAVAFEKILDDESIRGNIDAFVIEGHTDYTGSSDYNRELSSQRAFKVVNYLMQANPNLEQKYGRYFAATGYSEFRPIDTGTSEASLAKNRRIEISIIVKDSNIQNIINNYLEGTNKILEAKQE